MSKLVRIELPKPKITHYGEKGAFQAMIDALSEPLTASEAAQLHSKFYAPDPRFREHDAELEKCRGKL